MLRYASGGNLIKTGPRHKGNQPRELQELQRLKRGESGETSIPVSDSNRTLSALCRRVLTVAQAQCLSACLRLSATGGPLLSGSWGGLRFWLGAWAFGLVLGLWLGAWIFGLFLGLWLVHVLLLFLHLFNLGLQCLQFFLLTGKNVLFIYIYIVYSKE